MIWYWNVRDQIDANESWGTNLKYDVKDRNQIHNLSKNSFNWKHIIGDITIPKHGFQIRKFKEPVKGEVQSF